jgi:hypothetical protein
VFDTAEGERVVSVERISEEGDDNGGYGGHARRKRSIISTGGQARHELGTVHCFLLITAVLVITPGPIVTLVIATGASQGIRAALTTVAGTTLGNAILLAAIAFGLSWVLKNAAIPVRHPALGRRCPI